MGFAINVAPDPWQIVVLLVVMITAGVTKAFTFIETMLLRTGAMLPQEVEGGITNTCTVSSLFKAFVENTLLFVPTLIPLICH